MKTLSENSPVSVSRRELFTIFPAGAVGCLGCIGARLSAAQAPAQAAAPTWTEKAEMTYEGVFRFAFQRNYIPIMKAIAEQIGKEKLLIMLQETTSDQARKGMARRPATQRDFATWTAGLRSPDPLFKHALVATIVEDSPQAFEFRVSHCLWAKAFRESDAADIGYAGVCYPDFAVANAFNPKLKLVRTKTLMQGHDCCDHRYVMES